MPYIKYEYFHKGVYNQKVSDIKVLLKRLDIKQIKKWDEEKKKEASEWLDIVSKTFERFVAELRESIK